MKPQNRRPRAPRVPATTVNPDAGSYTITGDPIERAAADAAARQTWDAFPYYARRYGERGWRFSLSDSGWIATLCSLSPTLAQEKVVWLQRLLAARGMPSYLLECHLKTLSAELAARAPEDAVRHGVLAAGARMLREQRTSVLDAAAFEATARTFDDEVRSCEEAVPAMGVVLTSALVDDALEVADKAEVFDWALDDERFGARWIAAVQDFRRRIQRQLRDSGGRARTTQPRS